VFEILLGATAAVCLLAMLITYDGNSDFFHPLFFICPMFIFLYAWMPWRLDQSGALNSYFDREQLVFIQTFYLLGVLVFIGACLGGGWQTRRMKIAAPLKLPIEAENKLVIGGAIVGSIGLAAWLVAIRNVGGFVNAFSKSYAGGWDDSGYVRDSSLLLLSGCALMLASMAGKYIRLRQWALLGMFAVPWTLQAILTSRRGPTFAIAAVISIGWYMHRSKRPPLVTYALFGCALGYLVLFLVANRGAIHLGSEMDFNSDVTQTVQARDTGNEYIYGGGAILSSQRKAKYFWGRRYLAQILVRPIPSAIWPTKYEDFGVPELRLNAGTGEGFADALGWEGAVGSAPGIIADLWVEASWFALAFLAAIGFGYGRIWRLAVERGKYWTTQYVILSALSIYLVMQTMEAVIFRTLLLSVPVWIVWRWAVPLLKPGRSGIWHNPTAVYASIGRS
jgi:hypothetical protein